MEFSAEKTAKSKRVGDIVLAIIGEFFIS